MGIGMVELVVLLVLGVVVFGVPIALGIVLMMVLARQNSGGRSENLTDLRAEIDQLREEISALKRDRV